MKVNACHTFWVNAKNTKISNFRSLLVYLIAITMLWMVPARSEAQKQIPTVLSAQGGKAIGKQALGTDGSRIKLLHSSTSFEPNEGQGPADARFFARGKGYLLELEKQGARFNFTKAECLAAGVTSDSGCAVEMKLLGSSAEAPISGKDRQTAVYNYLPTGDKRSWHTGIPTFREVDYRDLYPGTDLAFYGSGDQLEYDFHLAENSNPKRIQMALHNVEKLDTDKAGDLVLHAHGRELRLLKPVAYQMDAAGNQQPVEAAWQIASASTSEGGRAADPVVTFALGAYDRSRPLTIDPVVDYSFFLTAPVNGYLYIGASTTDSEGNTYIAGTYPDIGRYAGFYQSGFFVTKLNTSGQVVYNTTFGTSRSPEFEGSVNGIAVDSTGKVYLAGTVTGAYGGALPYTANAYETAALSAYNNAFLSVVNAEGTALTYSTYFGGNSEANAVAVDSSGNAYLAGNITGNSMTVTTGAALSTSPGQFNSGFLAKFNPNASGAASLVYSTFIGAPASEYSTVSGVAVTASGNAFVTGNAYASQYPTTSGAYQYNGRDPNNDAFVSEINAGGTAFLYSALLGPGAGQAIQVDSSGDAYVAGTVYEDDFPTTSGAYQTAYPSGFVTELNPQGTGLIYSTFLGGPNDLFASGASYVVPTNLAIPAGCSSACTVYVTGVTNSSDWPLKNQVASYLPGSTYSAFYAELAGNGSGVLQSSYFASGAADFDPYQNVPGIGVDSAGNIYLAGDVETSNIGISQTTALAGEGFLAKIAPATAASLFAVPRSVTFPAQVAGVSTTQQGLAQPAVLLENQGTEAATLSSITVTPAAVFSQTNNCNGSVPAGGSCTLTLNFTPSASGGATQTGSIVVASNAAINPTIQLSGTMQSDRFVAASCSGVTPCPGLSFADTTVDAAAAAQIITLTNLGNVAAPLPTISSSLPDYQLLNNCPQTGTGLAAHASCEISVKFVPTEVGLRSGIVSVVATGKATNTISIPVTGAGVLSPNISTVVVLNPILNFGTEAKGLTSAAQSVQVYNSGNAPVTIFAPTVTTSGDASGVNDYAITANSCSETQLVPMATCSITVAFSPTTTGTRPGTLTIPTSASSASVSATLTGVGAASVQHLEFSPTSLVFPNQVIDYSSAPVNIYVYNAGADPVSIDRVEISGSYQITATTCPEATLQPELSPTSYQTCSITVIFSPKATGALTGAITVVDTEGTQSAFSLAGTAVAQAPSILLDPDGLYFDPQPVAGSSGSQAINVTNVGNIPVTVTAISVTGDYSVSHPYCNPPFTLQPGGGCGPLNVVFTPTKAASPDNGTLTVTSSGGTRTVSLGGTGLAATKALLITPAGTTGINFGTVAVGTNANTSGTPYVVNVYNAGTDPVTFSATPAISGTNAADFTMPADYCTGSLAAGTSCNIDLQFTPSASGSRSAVLTLKDDASTGSGTQTVVLAGTGSSTTPAYNLMPETITFAPTVITTTATAQNLVFVNRSAAPVTIASVALGSTALTRVQNYYGDCNEGAASANGGQCVIGIAYAPTVTGTLGATITLTDTAGKTYTAKAYGNAIDPGHTVAVLPSGLNFAAQPLLSTSATQTVTLSNLSGTPASIGQAVGSNVIVGSSTTGAYKVTSDGCSNIAFRSDYPNNSCSFNIVLTPVASTALGTQSGTITVPITFRDKTVTDYTITLTGTVVADSDSIEVSPKALTFPDQAVNVTPSTGSGDAVAAVYLTNNSNLPVTIGIVTGSNTVTRSSTTGQFSIWPATSGDACSGQVVKAGANCAVQLAFVPTTAASGVTGSLTFPITFVGGKTTTATASYSGNALAAKSSIQITPASANFGSQIVGQAEGGIVFLLTNNGNQPLAIGNATLTSTQAGTNFTRNGYGYNQCGAETLPVGSSCPIFVQFQPQTTGTINGILTIPDPVASGGPHKIPLVGVGLPTTQTVTVSQQAVSFGSQPVAVTGKPVAIYVTNEGTSAVGGLTYTLGGTNSSDFSLNSSGCPSALSGKGAGTSTCALLVAFSPASTSIGARSATVTVNYSGASTPISIALSGTGVADKPAATLFPASLAFSTTNVGSKSASQAFSITNTGSASLTVSKLTVTNTAEFAISSDGCTGKSLSAGADCLVYVTFSPTLGGNRSGSISVTDTAGTQTQPLTGAGYGIPKATFTPVSVAFGNQDLGTTSAAKSITLGNSGTDTLKITGIAVSGTTPADFTETNTCPASLAPAASCTFAVSFTPKAAGARSASIVITDNVNNVTGSTQSAALTGTGVGVPKAALSPASLTFAAQALHTASSHLTATLQNTGTGALSIASIAITGTDAADFAIPSGGNSCTTSLAVNASCLVEIVFTPSTTGARTASLVFTDNSGLVANSTQTVSLSGTGEVQVATPTFSPVAGSYASAQTVTISDTTAGAKIYYTTNGTAPPQLQPLTREPSK